MSVLPGLIRTGMSCSETCGGATSAALALPRLVGVAEALPGAAGKRLRVDQITDQDPYKPVSTGARLAHILRRTVLGRPAVVRGDTRLIRSASARELSSGARHRDGLGPLVRAVMDTARNFNARRASDAEQVNDRDQQYLRTQYTERSDIKRHRKDAARA